MVLEEVIVVRDAVSHPVAHVPEQAILCLVLYLTFQVLDLLLEGLNVIFLFLLLLLALRQALLLFSNLRLLPLNFGLVLEHHLLNL